MKQPPVLIVGAGPVGMTLAAFLTLNQVPFRIIDAKTGPVPDSRALGVHARTLELMRPTGLDKEFVRQGRITRTMRFYNRSRFLFSLGFKKLRKLTPYPFLLLLPQSATERILADWLAARGVQIEWQTTLASIDARDEVVQVGLTGPDGATRDVFFEYVAGCDGASSAVREKMGIAFSGDTYKAKFLLAEAEIKEDRIQTDASHVFLSNNTSVAVLPMPNGKYRIVGPDLSVDGKDAALDFSSFQKFLADNGLLRNLTINSVERLVSYRVHKRVADTFALKRVFLAGDSAHIHSPAGGQGMNTGMQDAINLAWKIAQVWKGKAGPGLLKSYGSERRQIASLIVNGTDKAMATVLSKNPLISFGIRWVAPLLFKFGTPSGFMQSTAQLNLDYSNSGKTPDAAHMTVGCRMPWLRFSETEDSFDLFNGHNFVLFMRCRQTGQTYLQQQLARALELKALLGTDLTIVMLQDQTWFKPLPGLVDADVEIRQFYVPKPNLPLFASLAGDWILVRPDGYIQSISNHLETLNSIRQSFSQPAFALAGA